MIDEAEAALPDVGPYKPKMASLAGLAKIDTASGVVNTLTTAVALPYVRVTLDRVAALPRPSAESMEPFFAPLPEAPLPRVLVLAAPAVCAALGFAVGLLLARSGVAYAERNADAMARAAIQSSLWGGNSRLWIPFQGPWYAGIFALATVVIGAFLTGASIWIVVCIAAVGSGHMMSAFVFRPVYLRMDERIAAMTSGHGRNEP